MKREKSGDTGQGEIDQIVSDSRRARHARDPHVASWNHIPLRTRGMHILYSSALIAYGAYGIAVDHLYIPGKRTDGVVLHGAAAWIMYAAMLCASANLLSVVVDHYDRRNNETNYRAFAKWSEIAGWLLMVLALLVSAIL